MDQNNTNIDMQESIGQNQDDNQIVVGQEAGEIADIELIQEKINSIKMEDEVKECIVKKYQRITDCYGLHTDTKALKDSLQKYEDDSVKEEFELQEINEEIEMTQSLGDGRMAMINQVNVSREELETRYTYLGNTMTHQIEPKLSYYMKNLNNLMHKMENIHKITEEIQRENNKEKEAKISDLDTLHKEIDRLTKEEAERAGQLKEKETEIALAEDKITEIKEKLLNTRSLKKKIEAVNNESTQHTLDKEKVANDLAVSNSRIGELQKEIARIENMSDELQCQEELKKFVLQEREKLLRDFAHLMELIQSNSQPADLEVDEIFQREIFKQTYYQEIKAVIDQLTTDNSEISNDCERLTAEKEARQITLEQTRGDHKQAETDLKTLQDEIETLKQDGKDLKDRLKTRKTEAQQYEDAIVREIQQMQTRVTVFENEIEVKRVETEKTVFDLSEKLKVVQAKTQQARARFLEANQTSLAVSLENNRKTDSDLTANQTQSLFNVSATQKRSMANEGSIPIASVGFIPSSATDSQSQKSVDRNLQLRPELIQVDAIPSYIQEPQHQSKRQKLASPEKNAFESDLESSFNVSYNTDVEDFMMSDG